MRERVEDGLEDLAARDDVALLRADLPGLVVGRAEAAGVVLLDEIDRAAELDARVERRPARPC